MDNLKFRRQFLFSAKRCKELENWKCEEFGTNILYVHPDCGLTRIKKYLLDLALIGHVIDPKNPNKTTLDILTDISTFITIDDVFKNLYSLVGRFVLIIKNRESYTFFHDACGLKSLFYKKYEGDLYAASQPLLLKLVANLEEGTKYYKYHESKYVKSNIEHWIPSGISLYDDVYQLIPNHYLDVSGFKQIRYWPNKTIEKVSSEDGEENFSALLKNIMLAANNKFKLALPVTAGWDSRIILSACKDISEDIFFYTLQYRDLTENSRDIKTPRRILHYLGYEHHIIDCRKELDKQFLDVYVNNTDIPHLNDWGTIADGMYENYPTDRIALKGNCAEIGRCFYYPTGKHPKIMKSSDILNLESYWKNIDYFENQISEWFDGIKSSDVNFEYNLLDLFYWEHRMGSWQAQSQLEWDIVQEAFTPFNSRELLDILLSIEPKYRCYPNYLFFKKSIKNLWEETLIEPINSRSIRRIIKDKLKDFLIHIRIFEVIMRIVKN